jgi:PAS domain S-box-containing protein
MVKKEYLRLKAEELLRSKGVSNKTLYEKSLEELVEELSIHQIELEHQNQELLKTQALLEESQDRYADLFNNAPAGYFIIDKNYTVIETNLTLCYFFGDLPIKSNNFSHLIHPDSQDTFYFFMKDLIKNKGTENCELKLKRNKTDFFYGRLIAVPEMPQRKNKEQWRVALIDVSHQKELELKLVIESAKAKESERLKSAFLANMSHEIRTPLNGILGFASLIYDDRPDPETTHSYAEIINKNGERLLMLINKILDLSKIESGNMDVDELLFEPYPLLVELTDLFQLIAQKNQVEIRIKVEPVQKHLQIRSDKNKLAQVLNNLLSNATKFTPKGHIDVGFEIMNGQIQFFVSDTGIGISKEGLNHLFKRFYQADKQKLYSSEGSGLGLSLSKAIVELLGGQIKVQSEENLGSRFEFNLPCPISYAQSTSNQQIVEVLVVEDDEKQARLLEIFLHESNVKTHIAENSQKAIDLITNNKNISLIMLDINLPQMNGLELARFIRKKSFQVPIIAMTGYSQEYVKRDALEVGCNDYIEKPIDKYRLYKVIRKYVAC